MKEKMKNIKEWFKRRYRGLKDYFLGVWHSDKVLRAIWSEVWVRGKEIPQGYYRPHRQRRAEGMDFNRRS